MLNEHCIPSCGVFCYDKMLRLSKKGCSRTKWRLDALPWICANHKDSHMTHQLEKAFDNEDKEYFRAASIGQELVVTIEHVEKCRKIVDWLDKIFLEKKLIDKRWEANAKAR